jgi:hypothetical protein
VSVRWIAWLGALGALGFAAPQDEEPASGEQLQAFLSATDDAGAAVVPAESRAYFDKLPDHAKQLFRTAADAGRITTPAHLQVILSLELDTLSIELFLRDNCILCHTDAEENSELTLFSLDPAAIESPLHLDLREVVSDTHFREGLSCAGCHGGAPTDTDMADEIYERWPAEDERLADRSWIPGFCGRCHDDPTFMRSFNPALPTDQLAKYRESQHGIKLFEEGDSKAAQCVSCHGTHGIRGAKSPLSRVHPQRIPGTCGTCHSDPEYMAGYVLADGSPMPTDQVERHARSVHGVALLEEDDIGAPACNDCHGNHAAMPPEVASVGHVCRTCHTDIGTLFDGSQHKQAFTKYDWPECGQCHGNHAILEADDEMLGDAPGSICHDCHSQYATHNPDCAETSAYFRASIEELALAGESTTHAIEDLAEKGLDVDDLTATVGELEDALRLSRSRIHSFDRSDFSEALNPGREAMEQSRTLVDAAHAEYRYRQRGLLIAIGVLATLAIVLYLKLRQIEAR